MIRYRLTLEYDGRPFVGWQRQKNGRSVQEVVENALQRLTGACVVAHAAGRTDSGVHACGQVIHIDLDREWPCATLCAGGNFFLRPYPVAFLCCAQAQDGFHARFSARARHYCYRIVNRVAPLTFELGRAWHVAPRLDPARMRRAASILVGHHDFSTFRHARCQARTAFRTLDEIRISRRGETICLTFRARSFLHRQVRSLTGALKYVGEGRWTQGDLRAALEARSRNACAAVAPAEGLYLMSVDYADWPESQTGPVSPPQSRPGQSDRHCRPGQNEGRRTEKAATNPRAAPAPRHSYTGTKRKAAKEPQAGGSPFPALPPI